MDLTDTFGFAVALKCEAFNFAGSIKLKAAVSMVEGAERDGRLRPGSVIVESSSGNLGIALAIVAAAKGYAFVCVTDPRSSDHSRRLIQAAGGEVVVVTEPDSAGGFLGSRIDRVRQLCAANPHYVWMNQYANPDNWLAHYHSTAPAIVQHSADMDFLFVGAGTTGTLMGCARYLRDIGHHARVVAVDTVGSVTFGGEPGPRFIPGLGTSRRPELVDETYVDEVVHVEELDTIAMCRRLARRGYLFGGSTGTVLAGLQRRMSEPDAAGATAVAISPDLGERYLTTVYDDAWVAAHYGPDALASLADPSRWSPAGLLTTGTTT
ncbi:2,3-diaminopropionate biosynthesis protein SbnA [Krasilnikovia sp. MM14-A1259]|uniref:2,3-diaminopropionate biosynthesis protein SbnA n=1 Tax=Krasilnikovia sp. MM14-A1259 TaxID=3373539 RepID=UPI00399CEF61